MRIACLSVMLLMLSFQMKGQKDYVKYQTFDEHKLKGVGRFNIKEPYVLVKKRLDTIFVIKSNDRNNILKYINKGKFWYHQVPQEPQDECACMRNFISKKFITNDTVFVFSHFPDTWLKHATIIIDTKKEITIIEDYPIRFDNEENVFKKIQNIASTYKDSLSYHNFFKEIQNEEDSDEEEYRPDNGWYQTFIKVYKGKKLWYFYDSRDEGKVPLVAK